MHSATRRSADRRRQRGVSVLEATAAAGVLAVGLMGFATNTTALTRAQRTAGHRATATELAQAKLERMRSMPLGDAALAPGAYADGTPLAADGGVGGPYTRTWVVLAKDTPHWGLKIVTVTVTWRDPSQRSTQVAAYVRCSTVPCS